MTDKNRVDEIKKKNVDNAQFVEDAKERLRWYTSEASEEEFDGDAVAALVNLIATLDESYAGEEEDEEQLKEQFKAYCNLYEEEEKLRRRLKSYKKSDDVLFRKESGRIRTFGKKGMAFVATAACLLLIVIVGSTLGVVNAGEDGGFFHWLKRDKEGTLAVTSPENVGVSVEDNYLNVYNTFEEVPEEYQQYLVRKEEISLLADYEFQGVECVEMGLMNEIREIFVLNDGEREIGIGILVYEDETMIARDKFINHEFLYSNFVEEKQQDVYMKKEENGEINYVVAFYQKNKKYFVSGEEVRFLEAISEEYMELIY